MAAEIKIHCSHTELVDIISLVEHPNNPNQHDERQINLLARIIESQGWRNPITVSRKSGYIVSGHGRLAAAKVLGATKVPVDYQDFENEAEETAHLLADNRVAELAELDFQQVGDLLKGLKDIDFNLDLTGFLPHEIEPLLEAEWSPPEVEDMDNSITSGHAVKFTDGQWDIILKAISGTDEAQAITDICKTHQQ